MLHESKIYHLYLCYHHLGSTFLQIILTVFYVPQKDCGSHIERFILKEQQENTRTDQKSE